jgi:Putative zinc-finger
MNHPTREEWMSYLYDELTAEERSNLAAHLAVCPDCKAQVTDWRAARTNLDAWQLPAPRPRLSLRRAVVRWAAAAALMIGVGFGAGRFAAAPAAEKIRAAVEPEIRQRLRQEFAQMLRDELDKAASATLAASGEQTKQVLADYARALETKQSEDNRAIYVALNKLESQLESQRLADYVSLKKELDTVAVLTDAGLRRTEQQLVQLADYNQPRNFSHSPQQQ